MSKAYLVYFVMFAGAIAGLWVILTLGAAVKAPDDLSGEWTVAWEGAPPADVKDSSMRIAQSGRFFTVSFGKREPIGFTLKAPWKGAGDGRSLEMELEGDPWKMNLIGDIPLGESLHVPQVRIELSGPGQHAGVARRVGWEPTTRSARGGGVAHAR